MHLIHLTRAPAYKHTLGSVIVAVNFLLAMLHVRMVSVRPCRKLRVELASYVAQQRPADAKKASCMAICARSMSLSFCDCLCVFFVHVREEQMSAHIRSARIEEHLAPHKLRRLHADRSS
jgi:hypothetical protein